MEKICIPGQKGKITEVILPSGNSTDESVLLLFDIFIEELFSWVYRDDITNSFVISSEVKTIFESFIVLTFLPFVIFWLEQ
jgi:hypothetical protein